MNNFKFGKDALILSIMTLITVLTWIGFEIYRTAIKTTIPEITQQQMLPLNPRLKEEIFESLKTNLFFSEELDLSIITGSPSAVLGASKKK